MSQSSKNPTSFMRKALKQAKVSFSKNEVPIGAVVVDEHGVIIGRGHNLMETKGCQTAHAEARAIEQACKKRGGWRLDGCTLYVTLEPCLMCYGLIHLSRIARVYYAATSPLFGYSAQREQDSAYRRQIEIYAGLKEQESADILRAFFQKARKKGKVVNEAKTGTVRED